MYRDMQLQLYKSGELERKSDSGQKVIADATWIILVIQISLLEY